MGRILPPNECGERRTYGISSNRTNSRKQEDYGNEESPETAPCVDVNTVCTHMPWSRLKFAECEFACDWDDVAPVKSNSTVAIVSFH